MRKLLTIAIGLFGFGSFAEPAFAEKPVVMNCRAVFSKCDAQATTTVAVQQCYKTELACDRNNAARGYNSIGQPLPPGSTKPPPPGDNLPDRDGRPGPVGGEDDAPTGQGFLLHKGLGSTSKPTGRTVNGQVEMITASGQTWLWNGRTNKVIVLNTANRQQYVTIRQGDPEVRKTAIVNGKQYNVASSAYADALAEQQAKKPPPKPPVQPGSVCSGWGCPSPKPPRTSTTVQVFDVKPKAPVLSIELGGFSTGAAGRPLTTPTKTVTPAAPLPALIRTPGSQLPAYRGLPADQQYKFENKRF